VDITQYFGGLSRARRKRKDEFTLSDIVYPSSSALKSWDSWSLGLQTQDLHHPFLSHIQKLGSFLIKGIQQNNKNPQTFSKSIIDPYKNKQTL
jgi:hypothetical protein